MALPLTICLVQQQPADEPPTAWSSGQINPFFPPRNRTALHFDDRILLSFVFPGHRVVSRIVVEDAEPVQSRFWHGDEKHVALQLPSAAPVAAAQSGHGHAVFLEGHDVGETHPSAEQTLVEIAGQTRGLETCHGEDG